MLLHWARFTNFRLLRDTKVDFSTDSAKPVTVIRAENESGKSTMHAALQWGFFGDGVLPTSATGDAYRLVPEDWEYEANPQVEIGVEIEFEHTTYQTLLSTPIKSTDTYLLRRQVYEMVDPDRNGKRVSSTFKLLRRTDEGYKPVDSPEYHLAEMLPESLAPVFFTDGDRALVFIQADKTTKRAQVQNAVRSLLGVDIMEKVSAHVHQAMAAIRKNAVAIGGNDALREIERRRGDLEERKEQAEYKLRESQEEIARAAAEVTSYDNRIIEESRHPNKAALEKQREQAKERRRRAHERIKSLNLEFSDLLKDGALSLSLLAPEVRKASRLLSELEERGTIPQGLIPVLEERLRLGLCICKADLGEGTEARNNVESLIRERVAHDDLLDRLTQLHFTRYMSVLDSPKEDWNAKVAALVTRRKEAEDDLEDATAAEVEVEEQLKGPLSQADIAQLVSARKGAEEAQRTADRKRVLAEDSLQRIAQELAILDQQEATQLKAEAKNTRQLAHQQSARDIQAVIAGTFNVLKTDKLSEVSDEMNRLFLEMINADPEYSTIHRAEITSDFDIVVTSRRGVRLDPDIDLNGASRRALTLAFILALTKVSGVVAPNVIDTPLGMTSGVVKRAIFEVAADHSSQLILFLTRSEIDGIEDLIDRHAGMVQTMTNTSHYPKALANDPHSPYTQALICQCNQKTICEICARVEDIVAAGRASTVEANDVAS